MTSYFAEVTIYPSKGGAPAKGRASSAETAAARAVQAAVKTLGTKAATSVAGVQVHIQITKEVADIVDARE